MSEDSTSAGAEREGTSRSSHPRSSISADGLGASPSKVVFENEATLFRLVLDPDATASTVNEQSAYHSWPFDLQVLLSSAKVICSLTP